MNLPQDSVAFGASGIEPRRTSSAKEGVVPTEKDVLEGPTLIEMLARVSAQLGEPDPAIAALQKLLSIPYEGLLAANVFLTPALLRLDLMFDPLRNDLRFQKLIASSEPKTTYR